MGRVGRLQGAARGSDRCNPAVHLLLLAVGFNTALHPTGAAPSWSPAGERDRLGGLDVA